jgi:uncharacterized protein YebE (UPF0316 family)
MLIFCIGMVEMVLATLWAKYVQEARAYASTFITVAHVFVWYYVLRTVVEQLNDVSIVMMYAAGCGIGNLLVVMVGEMLKKRHARRSRTRAKKHTDEAPVSTMPARVTFDTI